MCTNPRKIVNPTRFSYRGRDKSYLLVPCGNCAECRSQKSDEWKLRIWKEIKTYLDIGGKVIFMSPTYSPDCLPHIDIDDEDGNHHHIPCFSMRDKNRFLNSLRKDQERRGFTGKDGLPMRYIWASEYGKSKKGTRRSHYHVLIFIPPKLLRVLSHLDSENKWKQYLQSFWSFGWIRWSKPLSKGGPGIFVTSEFAGDYVSKYITKDLAFYENPVVNAYLYDSDGHIIRARYNKIKDRLPRHWQSLQFGAGLVEDFNDEDALVNGKVLHLDKELETGKSQVYQAPGYIKRKLMYIHDKQNQRYVYSDFGVKVAVTKQLNLIDKYIDHLDRYFDLGRFSSFMYDYEIVSIFSDYNDFRNIGQVHARLNELLSGRDKVELYMYDTVWSGLIAESMTDLEYLDSLDYAQFLDVSKEQMYLNISKVLQDYDKCNPDGIYKSQKIEDLNNYIYFDQAERFTGFSEILNYIHMCDSYVRNKRQLEYLKNRQESLELSHELCDYDRYCERVYRSRSVLPNFSLKCSEKLIERKNAVMSVLRQAGQKSSA